MKLIKKMLMAVLLIAAVTVQTDSFARQVSTRGRVAIDQPVTKKKQQVVTLDQEETPDTPKVDPDTIMTVERQKIEQAIIDTEKINTAATLVINDAREQLAEDKISYTAAAQIIGEQNYKMEQAKKQLAQLTGQSIEKVEDAQVQESYFSQLVSGVQGAGTGLLEKAGYTSTAQQKAIAQAIIDELKNQLQILEKEYAQKIKDVANEQEKVNLSQKYNALKVEIEQEIYRQQTITEEVMSTNKKLFWTAVGIAGAAVGGALAYQYMGTEVPSVPVTETGTQQSTRAVETATSSAEQNSIGTVTGQPMSPSVMMETVKESPRRILLGDDLPENFGMGAQPGESYAEKAITNLKRISR